MSQRFDRVNGLARNNRGRSRRAINCVAVLFIAFGSFSVVNAEPNRPYFELPKKDSANAGELANHLTALSTRVDRNEAELLADCAYATVARLRREYRMFGTPIFNNFLVYHGIRKRGYCYQWSADLLIALDKLKLNSLELHWGEAHAGTWRENNCIVVTAKGQPFQRGIMLECWRDLGHLHFGPVMAAATNNFDPYVENSVYARFVLERAKASNASATNRHVAFQRRAEASGKTGDH